MADSFVELNTGTGGDKLDSEQLTVAATTVKRERTQLAGALDTEITRVLATDPAAADHGLVVRASALDSPQSSTASVATVSPDATGSVDSTQITSAKTAKLLGFTAVGSVPFKVDLQSVLNNAATTLLTEIGYRGRIWWRTPHKDLIQQAESATAGFDGFRLVFTNLDTGAVASDFYGTFFWDEV